MQMKQSALVSFRPSSLEDEIWEPTPSLGVLYPHNTYHGQPSAAKPHVRAPLNLDFKQQPIRFTDSPMAAASGPPRSRRRSSKESQDGKGEVEVRTRLLFGFSLINNGRRRAESTESVCQGPVVRSKLDLTSF